METDETEVIITLPGIQVEWIAIDNDKNYVGFVKSKLDRVVGPYARRLFFQSLQRRSVDFIAKEMKNAREKHDKQCKMCLALDFKTPGHARSCHLISRATVFWIIVDTIMHNRFDPLSENALKLLELAIKANPYHSHPDYMVPFCVKHDNSVLKSLEKVTKCLKETDPEKCYFKVNRAYIPSWSSGDIQ